MEAIKNLIKKVLTTIFVMIVGITIQRPPAGIGSALSAIAITSSPVSGESRCSRLWLF